MLGLWYVIWHIPKRRCPKWAVEIMRSHAAVPLFSQDANNDKPIHIKRHRLRSCKLFASIVIEKGNSRVRSHNLNSPLWTPFI